MKKWNIYVVLMAVLVSGCNKKAEAPKTEAAAAKISEEASYEEGKGLFLPEETRKGMQITFAQVEKQSLRAGTALTAQVYRAATEASGGSGKEKPGYAYATAWLDAALPVREGETVEVIAPGKEASGKVWKIVDSWQRELLIEVADPGRRFAVGDFVPVLVLSGKEAAPVLTLPKTTILHASTGTFVYVEKGGRFVRVPVTLGQDAGERVAIVSGVAEGENVVSTSAEAIYLVELRFTKGGAHAD